MKHNRGEEKHTLPLIMQYVQLINLSFEEEIKILRIGNEYFVRRLNLINIIH